MYQQTVILGNLGSDPIQRETKQAEPVAVANFSVATSRQWNDTNGERQQFTTWFQVSAFGRLAEVCSQYLKKGHKVMVHGEMSEPRIYKDRNGNARADLNLRAREVKFLTPRGDAVPMNGQSDPARTAPVDNSVVEDDPMAGHVEEIPF